MAYTDYENPFAGDSELASLYNEERKKAEAENLLSGSIRSGVLGLGGSVNSALAAGGRILGADGFAEGREAAADQMSAQAAGAGYKTPHFQEIGGVGDALGWGIGMVGSNLPLLGTMALTGAAGGIGGSAVLGRAKAAKAVGDIAAKQSAARLTALGATPAEVAAASASAAAQAAGRINAKSKLGAAVSQGLAGTNKGAAIGRHAGAAVPYLATTTGENYNVLRNDPDAEGTAAEQAKGALAAGAVQTALGTMFEPLGVTQKILARSKAARQAAASGAKIPGLTAGQTWALASAGEGVTEAGEQLVQQYMHNQYNEDAGYDKMQLLESALGGAVVGGAYAAPSGLYSMAMQKRHERLQKEERERGPTNPVDINERLRNLESIPADKRTQKDNKEEATLRSRQTLALLNANAQGISNVDALDNMGAKMDQRFREMMGSQPEAGDAVEQQAWSEAITTLSEARNAISEHKRALTQQSDPTVVPPADPTADQNNLVPSTNPYDVTSGLPTQTQLQTDPHNVGTPTESILDGAGTDITPTQTWIDPATGVPSATPPQEPVNNDAVVDQEQFENLSNISHGLATAVNDLNRAKTDTSLVSDQAARRAPDTVRLPTKEEEAQLQAQQAAADLAQQAEIQQNDPSASVTEMEVDPETGLQKDPEDVTNQEPNADPLGDPTDAELIDLLRQRDAQAQVQQDAGFDAAPSNREYSEDEYRAMDAVLRGYAPKGTTAVTEEVYDNLKRTYEEEQATQQETNQDNAGERTNPFDAIIRKVQERGTGAISDPDVSSIEAGADVLRAREAVRRGYAPVGTEAVTKEVYDNLKEAHIERLKQQAAGRNSNEINTIDDVRNDTFDPILRKLQERGTGEVADPTSYDLRGGVDPQTLSSGQPASVIHNSRVDPLETFIDRDVSETAGYHNAPPSDPIEIADDSVVTPIADRIQPDKYLTDLGVVDDYNSTEGLNSQLSVTQAYTNPQTGERVARTIIDRGLINAIFQPPGNTAIQKRAIDEMAARYNGDTPFYVYRKLNKIDSKDNQARTEVMQSFEFGRRLSAHKVLGPVSEKLGINLTELAVEYLDGVAPARLPDKAHELLSLLLSTQDEVTNTAVKDLNASETQVMGQRMYALVNSIPPDMLEVVGLSPHKTDTETSIPIGEIADLGDRYTVTRSNNGLYTTITDVTGNALGRGRGSTLELPTDFLTGRLYNLPIILNGQEIQKNEVRDVMTESLRNGTPPKAERLLAAAKKSAEWRTNPLERTIVTGYFDGEGVSHRLETDVIDSRPRPISDEFNIQVGKVKGTWPEIGMAVLINDMAHKGLVMVGKMDNSLYFATPEDSMRLFHKLGITQKVVDNRHMIERVGVLLKKQSGNQSEISLANWINGTADFHTDKTHDGVMVIGKGVRTSQGVLMHTQLDQFGNETYAFDKGMARSPLQVRDWSVSADGTLRLGDVQQEEGESLNKSLQLTQELDPNNLSPIARMFSMFPPAIQRSNRANMQQMLFSVAKPLEFLRKDRKERFHEANVFELMADYQKQLAQKGIPISKIVTANSFAKKMTELIVSSTRGYTFSSEHVNEGEFMLLPEAYQQMNREYMEAHNGQTLQPGTEVLIHRDPSLSDGSSMHTYKFSGIMTLQTADVQHGMIVNPKDPLWKASAGDFDGDAGVAILKQEFFDEIDTYRTPALDDISFVDKGGTAHSGADALLNRELITNYPSAEDRSRLIATDQLNTELVQRASFFDTKIGTLMAMAQRARELGIAQLPVTVVYPKRIDGRVTYKVATVQLRGLLAKLGQASISSKKHPVWIEEAERIVEQIKNQIMNVSGGSSINTLLGIAPLYAEESSMTAAEKLFLRDEIIRQGVENGIIPPDKQVLSNNPEQDSNRLESAFDQTDVVPRDYSPIRRHRDQQYDSKLKRLVYPPRRSFSSLMREFMKAPSREKSVALTDLLNNSTISLHEALIAHLRAGNITTDSEKFKVYEEEMLQKVTQAGTGFKMKEPDAEKEIAYNLRGDQRLALSAKLGELANSPDRKTRFYNMLDAAWMLARWTEPNVEATMDSQHLYDMISEAEETNPVMGDADLHTELALRAYAVGNSIIKNGVFTTDQSLSPVLRAGAQSIIQHSDRGSRGLELASHFRNQYDDIQANHQELDQTEEPEKYDTYQNKISDLKSEINFLVTRGDISVAELVNNGPLQLIDSLVTGEQLQPLLDAARADVSIPVPMSVTGVNQHGQEMDASAIPHGVYKREINPDGTISYKHVTGAQKNAEGKQELVFSGVVIQRATKLEDMAHSTEAHVNSEEYIKTRASSSQNLLFVSSQKTSSATEQKQLDFAAIDMGEFYTMLGERKDSPDSATMFGVAAENTAKGEVQKITGRKIDGGDFGVAAKADPGEQVTGDINVFQTGKREGQGMGADELYGNPQRKRTSVLKIYKPNKIITFRGNYTVYNPVTRTREKVTEVFVKLTDVKIEAEVNGSIQKYSGAEFLQKFENAKNRPAGTAIKKITLTGVKVENPQDTSAGGFKDTEAMRDKLQYKRDLGGKTNSFVTQNLDLSSKEEAAAAMGLRKAGTVTFTDKHLDSIPAVGETTYLVHHYTDKNGVYVRIPYKATVASKTPSAEDASKGTVEYYIDPKQKPKPERLVPPDMASVGATNEDVNNAREPFMHPDGRMLYLSNDQTKALRTTLPLRGQGMQNQTIVVKGAAGTGKSTFTRELMRRWRYMYGPGGVVTAAPTHRAGDVIRQISTRKINGEIVEETPKTIASLLGQRFDEKTGEMVRRDLPGKIPENGPPISKLGAGDVLIVDEASMISKEDYMDIKHWQELIGFNMILMGDTEQMAPFGSSTTSVSMADEHSNTVELLEVQRQKGSNSLLTVLTDMRGERDIKKIRNAIRNADVNLQTGEGIITVKDHQELKDVLEALGINARRMAANPNLLANMSYTNNGTSKLKSEIHQMLYPERYDNVEDPQSIVQLAEGEHLTGYRRSMAINDDNTQAKAVENGINYTVETIGPVKQRIIGKSVGGTPLVVDGSDVTYTDGTTSRTVFVVTPKSHYVYSNAVKAAQAQYEYLLRFKDAGTASQYLNYTLKPLQNTIASTQDVITLEDGKRKTLLARLFDSASVSTVTKMQGGTVNVATFEIDSADAAIIEDVNNPMSEEEKADTVRHIIYTALSRASKLAIVIDPSAPASAERLNKAMLIEQNIRNSNPANPEAWFEKKEEAIPTEDASKYGVSAREEAQNVPFEGSVEAVAYTDPADNMQSKPDSAGKASTTEKGVPVGQGDKAPEAEILQKLSEKYAFDENGQSAIKDNLQNAIDSLRALLDVKAPVELVTAEQMHALLVREGGKENLEAAAKIIQHGRGEVGGYDGFHYVRPDGTRFIYVTAKKGDLRQAQLLITLHELGHTVIESHWEEMAKTDPNLATSIITDMIKVLKKRGEKKISPELRKALNTIGGGKTANQIINEINMNSDPAIKAEFHRYFNEWLADNIAKWMVTSDEARSATNNWFKSIATRIKNSFKAVLDYLKNIAGIDSTQVPGVKQWMENLVVRNQEAVTRIYGQRNNFTSIADVMYQRRAALRAWAETGMPNMTALNEMVPEIIHNLDGLIPSQDANVLRRIAMENNMRHRMLMLIGKDTQAAEAINKSADHAVAYMYALTTLGVMRQTGTAEALTTKLRESILENMRGAMEATDAEINDIVGNLNKPVLERTGSTLIPENSMAARLYKKRNERHQQGVAGMFTKMNNKYNEYFDWYLTDAPTRILRTGVPALREFVNAINATASELGGLQRAGTYELTLTNYNTFSHRGAEILSKLTEDQKQEVREVLFKHPQNFKKSGPAMTAVKDLRNLLERLYEYQSVAGTDVKHRKDYFPMILNNEYIKENIQEVVALYTSTDKLKKEWEGVRGEYVEWLNKAFKNGGITSPNDLATAVAEIQKMTIPEFTEFYLKKSDEHMLPNWQLHGLEDNKVHTPGFRFSNPRLLDFLLETGDKNLHEKIVNTLENDIGQVLERYIRASAKRAQHEHLMSQFGGNGLQHLWDKARAQGATEADIKLAVKYMDALQGMLGIEERDAIDKLIDKTDENSMWQKLRSDKTSVVSENIQKIISWVLTYMNISHLTLSAFAAAIDPFGQLMRHGSGKIFADSISETYTAVRNAAKNMPRDELSRFIDFTGVTEAQMSRADMRNTYSAGVETKTTHKINEAFFKYNGTAGLTEFSRMLAGRAAFKSIAMWKKNAESGNGPEAEKAWNELRSLGIMPEEIELSKEGNPIVLTWEEREALHGVKNDPNSPVEVKQQAEQKIKNDDAVRTAVFRFVDQSNVRPNPTSRQLIGSNPYYAIMMQWKTFSTTWDANIWRPMVAKLVERGELTPAIMSVGVLLPVMLFADIIRDAVTTAFDDDDDLFSRPGYKTNWTLLDHVEHAAKRTGFYGKHELMADIVEPMSKGQYDKALAEVGGVATSDTNKVLKYGMSSMPYPGGNVLKPWGRDLENNEPDVSERSFRL